MFAFAGLFIIFYFISSAIFAIIVRFIAFRIKSKYGKCLDEQGIDRRSLFSIFYFPVKKIKILKMDDSPEKRRLGKYLSAISFYKLYTAIGAILVCGLILIPWGGQMQRSPTPGFGFTSKTYNMDESSLEYQMRMAFLITDEDECNKRVEELLKQGADPDKMAGQFEWIDTNPLWTIAGNKELIELFLRYGADVKNRPYVANVVSRKILADKNPRKKWLDFHNAHPQQFIYKEAYVFDVVKLLLENGADPNMKCAGNKVLLIPTDWNYRRYNEKYGKSAINYCIEENYLLLFPLLIEYGAKLDEDSLKLAEETTERTGSTEMEELVLAQWERQSANAAHKRKPGRRN